MDFVTHLALGAAVAQLPAQSKSCLSWQKRSLLGATSAIFPDIDYLLFFWQPLEFLAYWHRAETHSLLLAPIWAWLLSLFWRRTISNFLSSTLIFRVCLMGILSHVLIDSFTVFGTQWFAPLSDLAVAFDLLFVVDGYFTATVLVTLIMLILRRNNRYRILWFTIPIVYLLMLAGLKLTAYNQLSLNAVDNTHKKQALILLPQPFSPLYWQAIEPTDGGFNQAYLRLADDQIATQISEFFGLESHQQSYQQLSQLNWNFYPTLPQNINWRADALQVWNHHQFEAFRDFADYPIFFEYQQSIKITCVWFSDLRYHWPNFIPSFRYGMCRRKGQSWKRYRMKYFSHEYYELQNSVDK
ncbi:MAG: metal-dependent hydrolase [Deltaproteobacteria bacterium]|nr:metal-dependent hydrolase [Deltaproteobacteria bacterium]